MSKNNITVLVSTCDSYSILWDDFNFFFKKNWELDCEVIFVSETIKNNFFKTITPGTSYWGYRNLLALDKIKTDLVFWILDDYFLCQPFTKEDLKKYITDFIEMDMDRLQISPRGLKKQVFSFNTPNVDSKAKFEYKQIDCNSEYSISMQPSIWKKSYIKKVLKPEYTPWQFEVEGSKLNKSNSIYIDESIKFHPYFNAVRKKNVLNLTRIIGIIDKLIEKVFYGQLPFKYSRGYKKFMKSQKAK